MGNYFVKFPNFSELKDAKPTTPSTTVPAPKTFFNLELRIVVLVILAAMAALNLAGVILTIPFLWNPFIWILFILELLNLAANVAAVWAVYRLIPEWMVAYGWFIVIYMVVRVISFISYVVLGAGWLSGLVQLIFAVLFTAGMVGCMLSLRAYALACRGLGI